MNTTTKTLAVATAVMTIALSCLGCGAANSNGAATTAAPTQTAGATSAPTAAPTWTPTAAPTSSTPAVMTWGEPTPLMPGRYTFPAAGSNPAISITVPSGWSGDSFVAGKDSGVPGRDGPVLFAWPLDHGFVDPCTDHTPVVPAAGSGAAGLLGVIARQPGLDAGPVYGTSVKGITDVTVGGHDGKYVEYTVTADPATCGSGQGDFWIWGSCPAPATVGCEAAAGGDARWGAGHGNRERLYAIDVDGKTYTFFTNRPADLPAAERKELQQVLDTMVFEPAS